VQGCTNPNFNSFVNFRRGTVVQGQTFNLGAGRRGHHNGNGHRRGSAVIYYPYAYPYPYPVGVGPEDQYDDQEQEQPEPPGATVFDRRSNVQYAPNPTPGPTYARDVREEAQPAPPAVNNTPPEPAIPVVLVYKDGHEREVANYAIVGDTLYDIGTFVAKKIKLADLDMKATIQKNEDRGVDFTIPAALRPKA
jgi:hypothetical protein